MNMRRTQMLTISLVIWISGSVVLINGQNTAQNSENSEIKTITKLFKNKKFAEAEKILDTLLKTVPNNINLLLLRGSALSNQRKFYQADRDFQKVLSHDPQNIKALTGIAYSSSWTGKYARAEEYFNKILTIKPGHTDARKGLAYIALWKGDVKQSIKRFEFLVTETPDNSDLLVGLGQALLKANRRKDAKSAFSRAMEFDPGRKDARDGYDESLLEGPKRKKHTPRIDLTLLGGYTSSETAGIPGTTSETGFRFIEIAVEPIKHTRLWFQVDNGLSLDNASLVRTNERAPTYWVGGLVNYKRNYLTKFAYGRRNLPNNISQNLFDIEQVFFLRNNYSYNVGAIIAPRSDSRTEFTFHTGVGVPVGEHLRLEPTFFYAKSGFPGDNQFRGLLAGDYTFSNGLKLGGGFAAGKAFRPNPLVNDTITDIFFRASVPVWKHFRPQVLLRREDVGNSQTTVLTFGFTWSNKELK